MDTELDRKLEQSLTVAEYIGVVGPRINIPTVDRFGPSHDSSWHGPTGCYLTDLKLL